MRTISQQTNSNREKAFFAAVKNGDQDTVVRMGKEHTELLRAYDYDEFGAPPLNLAGQRNDLSMMETLVELGADVNQKSDWWAGPWSPALLSLNCGNNAISTYLVSQGAEVDVHLAAGLGRLDRLTEILDADPTLVHVRGGDGCTALHFAGSPDVVDVLLDRGADIEARDVDHWSTPVQWVAGRNAAVVQRLFDRGATPDIFSATLGGAEKVVARLIATDADVLNWRINQDYFPPGPEHDVHNIMTFTVGADATPLHAAAVGNHPSIIKLLVAHGLDVNVKGAYDDCTALHLAAWNDKVDAASALLDAGAAIDAESGKIHSNTPMGWAIVAGSLGVAKLLLERGCEVRDYYMKDAQHGIAGDFRQYASPDRENYKRIAEIFQG